MDVASLTPDHTIIGLDGSKWIHHKRQKTDATQNVPLLPKALEIIEKYKSHPLCVVQNTLLPVKSNQKMNAYLKEIADVCGIEKNLTTHLTRHTFATTVTLTNGVPIETVSALLGHSDIKMTQHYAKVVGKKVSQDMDALKQKLEERKSKKEAV